MLDIGWTELVVIAIVLIIVVGPKDLPILLRTVGKYLGVIRRQAAEFRQQFDEAMREAELDHLKKEFDDVKREVRATMDEGARAVDSQIEAAAVKADPPRFGTSMPATPPQSTDKPAESEAPLPTPAVATPDKEPDRGAA